MARRKHISRRIPGLSRESRGILIRSSVSREESVRGGPGERVLVAELRRQGKLAKAPVRASDFAAVQDTGDPKGQQANPCVIPAR